MAEACLGARARIEVAPNETPIQLPSELLHEMCAHALDVQPEECCGLVLGTASDPFRQVVRCRNEMSAKHRDDPQHYPRDGRTAFYMNEIDYLHAQKLAEAEGERVTAIYHSHVDAGAYLSEMDQQFATHPFFPFPDAAQIVLAVWERQVVDAAIFERGEEGFCGARLELSKAS